MMMFSERSEKKKIAVRKRNSNRVCSEHFGSESDKEKKRRKRQSITYQVRSSFFCNSHVQRCHVYMVCIIQYFYFALHRFVASQNILKAHT